MTGRLKRISTVVIAAGLVFCSIEWNGAGRAKASESAPLAVVAGKPITADDFRKEMARRRVEPGQEGKEELLDSMVRSELLFASAKSAGYENDPEVLAAVRQVIIGKYLRDNLEPRLATLKATDQEAEAYYKTHISDFGVPNMVQAALVRIAVPPKASAEKRAELLKRAEAARIEALALPQGSPAFGSVAVKYSDDQGSRYRGGDIGWLQSGKHDGRWDRKVSDAIFSLKAQGEVSPVIEASDGFYLVKLVDVKGAATRSYAEVKDGVHYVVVQEKRKRVEEEFMEQIKMKIPVTVNRGELGKISPPEEEKNAPPPLPAR
jgi:parvulin-like peptidyl-prolyl isomerase